MADPYAHIEGGLVFICYSIWIHISTLRRYLDLSSSNEAFRAIPSQELRSGFPLEAYFKVFGGIIFTIGFLRSEDPLEFRVFHALIFCAFTFSGATDLLLSYGCNLPSGLDYAVLSYFYGVAAFSMTFHLHGSPSLMILHKLLAFLAIAATLSCLIEWKNRESLLAAMLRPYFTLLIGTWLIQIAYHIHTQNVKAVDWNSHRLLFWIPCFFLMHTMAVMLLMTLLSYLYCRKHAIETHRANYQKLDYTFSSV